MQEYKPGRINVVARLENGAGPVFAFNTHMDVVPVGEGWSSDPFTLKEADGRLYGRGACDCKGPLAAMLEAMRMLAADRAAWSGTLLGVFVADEEIASEGAKFYASRRPKIDCRGRSASRPPMRPLPLTKAVCARSCACTACPAHSGTPHLGENAIYRAGELLGLIAEHHEKVVRHRTHPLVGAASLTVTRMNGGHADNVLPGRLRSAARSPHGSGRGRGGGQARDRRSAALARERFGLRAEIVDYKATTGGATRDAVDTPIVQASLAASRAHGVAKPGPFGFQGGLRPRAFFAGSAPRERSSAPGDLAVAHKPDEFVPVG